MLLKTRFYIPPLRKQSVIRHALIKRLDATSGGELIVVSAPPGYGKTTLLSQWLHTMPHTFAWLALDETQSNPVTFWQYFIEALRGVQPNLGAEAARILVEENSKHGENLSPQRLSAIVISLLNDLDSISTRNSGADPITLVLDDFQKLTNPELLNSLNVFLDHLPPAIRIAITTRSEPFLNLSRRRANHQLTEILGEELTFDIADGLHFLRDTMGLNLEQDEAETVLAKTEGWAVGLQLVALALQRQQRDVRTAMADIPLQGAATQDYPGAQNSTLNRDIADYLFDEVFMQQPADLRAFLVLTAIPSKFCAALANELVGRHDSMHTLKQIDQQNLFLVPLDNHRTWYRYHDLFRQFLLHRLDELPLVDRQSAIQTANQWIDEGGYSDIVTHTGFEILPVSGNAIIAKPAEVDADNNVLGASTEASPLEPLTKRETQVMAYLSEGLSNKQIAALLNISLNTLKVHIRNLYGKMGVENRSQALVKMANSTSDNP